MREPAKPRLVFVLSDLLGWKTYAAQLQKVAAERDDFEAVVKILTIPRVALPFTRWVNTPRTGINRLRPVFDPISVAQRTARVWWNNEISTQPVHAGFAAAHVMGGVLQEQGVPYGLGLDITRPIAMRDLHCPPFSEAMIAREASLLRGADVLAPMSGWVAQSLMTDFGCRPEHITVMPPAAIVENMPQTLARHEGNVPARILFVGNDPARKGLPKLIDWVSGPLAGVCELTIVSTEVEAGEIAPGVRSMGRQPHAVLVNEIFPEMDVFCLPTKVDMSPQVLMEAAFAGLPSIASDIGAIPEMVRDGVTGILKHPTDDAGFLAALTSLAKDPERRRKMGHAARAHAMEHMNARTNFNALFDRLIEAGNQPKGQMA